MTNTGRTALVLGATGGIGGEAAAALARHGWRIRALLRDPARAQPAWEAVAGDAMDAAAVRRAAEGADIILHAVNPPGYRNWAGLVLPMIDSTIAAARATGARILLPGTIYNYGPDAFPVLREDSPQHPTTRKGAIRVELERRLEASGVRGLILRAGDFFGPHPGNNWFSQALVKPGQRLRAVTLPGRAGIGHAWAYLPDLAETFCRLADREQDLEPFARFHFAGHWDADGSEMAAAILRVLGRPGIRTKPMPWWLLRLAAPFHETMRELVEIKPLWRTPVRLDNARLVALLGTEPHTPLDAAVAASLRGLGVS